MVFLSFATKIGYNTENEKSDCWCLSDFVAAKIVVIPSAAAVKARAATPPSPPSRQHTAIMSKLRSEEVLDDA